MSVNESADPFCKGSVFSIRFSNETFGDGIGCHIAACCCLHHCWPGLARYAAQSVTTLDKPDGPATMYPDSIPLANSHPGIVAAYPSRRADCVGQKHLNFVHFGNTSPERLKCARFD